MTSEIQQEARQILDILASTPFEQYEVRIACVTINQWQRPGLSYELETLILQATNPPCNVKIPKEL